MSSTGRAKNKKNIHLITNILIINKMESTYIIDAKNFLKKCGVEFKAEFSKHEVYFDDDKDARDIYKLTLTKDRRSQTFIFGQSIAHSCKYAILSRGGKTLIKFHADNELEARRIASNSRYGTFYIFNIANGMGEKVTHNPAFAIPTEYDLLACLQKYEVGTFENFCANFGYDTDSRRAKKTYKAVLKEYAQVCTIFSPKELEEMQEIQ